MNDYLTGILADNMFYIFLLIVMVIYFVVNLISILKNSSEDKSSKLFKPYNIAGLFIATLFVFSFVSFLHFDALKECEMWHNIEERSSSYCIFINGAKVDYENIDLKSYRLSDIVVDDDKHTIKIAY